MSRVEPQLGSHRLVAYWAGYSQSQGDFGGLYELALTAGGQILAAQCVAYRGLRPHEMALRQHRGHPVLPSELRNRVERGITSVGAWDELETGLARLLQLARAAYSGHYQPLVRDTGGRVSYCFTYPETPRRRQDRPEAPPEQIALPAEGADSPHPQLWVAGCTLHTLPYVYHRQVAPRPQPT